MALGALSARVAPLYGRRPKGTALEKPGFPHNHAVKNPVFQHSRSPALRAPSPTMGRGKKDAVLSIKERNDRSDRPRRTFHRTSPAHPGPGHGFLRDRSDGIVRTQSGSARRLGRGSEAIREAFLAPEWGRQHVARGVSPWRTGRHPPPDFPRPPPQPRATPGVGAADGGTVVVGIRVQGLTPLATC